MNRMPRDGFVRGSGLRYTSTEVARAPLIGSPIPDARTEEKGAPQSGALKPLTLRGLSVFQLFSSQLLEWWIVNKLPLGSRGKH